MKSEQITPELLPTRSGERRRYDDACGTAHGLDLIGERWSLLVMRELMFGPRRFSDLRTGLPGLSANVLTQRLEGLEASGIVRRRRLAPPAGVQVYELTEWGLEAQDVLCMLGRWAARSPAHDTSLPLSAASLMLSFRTMLASKRAGDVRARIGFRLGRDDFVGTLAADGFTAVRGAAEDVDATIAGDPAAIAAIVYGGRPIEEAIGDGSIIVTGDHALAARFTTLFELPAKAGPQPG